MSGYQPPMSKNVQTIASKTTNAATTKPASSWIEYPTSTPPRFYGMHPGYNTPHEIEVMENVPMSRANPDPYASERGYWESPQRIFRYYNLIRAAPKSYQFPDWMPVDEIKAAYKYMLAKNAGKPFYAWLPLGNDDPATPYLRSMQAPPNDVIWTSRGPVSTPTATQTQSQDTSPFATPGVYENMPWYGKAT